MRARRWIARWHDTVELAIFFGAVALIGLAYLGAFRRSAALWVPSAIAGLAVIPIMVSLQHWLDFCEGSANTGNVGACTSLSMIALLLDPRVWIANFILLPLATGVPLLAWLRRNRTTER